MVTLSPGAVRHFFVASAASVFFKGKFRWYTNAYTRSSYRLAGSIQQPGGTNCCGYSQLKWLTYSKMGSAAERLYMKDDISNWMTGKGPYYHMSPGPFGGYDVNSDIGSFIGPPPAGCLNPIIFPQEKRSFFAQEEKGVLQAVSSEGGFWILNNIEGPLSYRILDATGRLMAQGTATEERQKLANTDGFASGLYFINTSDSKGTQNAFKIVR